MGLNRIKTMLEHEQSGLSTPEGRAGVADDLRVLRERVAKLRARGGLFATIAFGEEIRHLMERCEGILV